MGAHSALRSARMALVVAIITLGGVQAPQAQTDPERLALDVAAAQEANQAALTHYSWRVKSTIEKGGEVMANSISEMRFDTAGKLESTRTGGESFVEQKRGLRGRAQKHELEDFSKYLEGLIDHSSHYIFMSKGTLVDVFDRAEIIESESSTDISAAGLFVEGDELHLSVDPSTKMPVRLTFTTTYEEDTVNGTVTLGVIEGGPTRPVSVEFDIPTKEVTITSETYDWIEQK